MACAVAQVPAGDAVAEVALPSTKPGVCSSEPASSMYWRSALRKVRRKRPHEPVALQSGSRYLRVRPARETVSKSSKDVTTPSTTGKPPWVSTGEWRPLRAAVLLAVTADGAVGQQRLEARARQGGKSVRQGLVQADAGCVDARFQPLAQRGVQSGVQRRVFVVDQIRVGHGPS